MTAEVLAVHRERRFSPGRVEDDAAIMDLTAERLRSLGLRVAIVDGDRLSPPGAVEPRLVLAMCQGEEALAWLDRLARRSPIVNSPASIRSCYRVNMLERLAAVSVPEPVWQIAGDSPPPDLDGGPWLKRGDVHAMEAGDVRRVFTADDWRSAGADFARRGVRLAIVQEHVEGEVYKFYGVERGFFRAYGLPPPLAGAAEALARAGARALGLEVWGGDGVVARDGSIRLIDLNDWPSFSRCREEAAAAIAARVVEILDDRDPNGRNA